MQSRWMSGYCNLLMIALSRRGQLSAFKHGGFWQAMDTLRDKNHLDALWASGKAPWKVWP